MTKAQNRRQKPSAPRVIGANDDAPLVANDNKPCVIMLGYLPVVSRRSIDELSPGEMARIGRIEAAVRGRRKAEAAKMALEFEASLGITAEERIAAMRPANDLDRAIEAALGYATKAYAEDYTPPAPKRIKGRKGRGKPQSAKAPPKELPPGELTQDLINRLNAAERMLQSKDFQVRVKGTSEIAAIRTELQRRVRIAEAKDAREETIELELLRGSIDEAEAQNIRVSKAGFKIRSRDGLESLRTIGGISPNQYAAALRFRRDYQLTDPERGLSPPNTDRVTGGGGEDWARKQREIIARIAAVRNEIAGLHHEAKTLPNLPKGHPTMVAIFALDEIAGKGRNLADLTKSGSVKAKLADGLRSALDAAAIVYGVE